MAHTLPDLPYAADALAPHISAETLEFHHGKHHAGYVTKLNAAVEGKPYSSMTVEELVERIDEIPESARTAVFNNAAQHFNHSFYWKSLSPSGGGEPQEAVAEALNEAFGSFSGFQEAFTKEAAGHFGSGWVWLVQNKDGALTVVGTHDADCPLAHGQKPLLTVDVWEHAYYIDYRNNRAGYLDGFWNLVNWDFVAENLG